MKKLVSLLLVLLLVPSVWAQTQLRRNAIAQTWNYPASAPAAPYGGGTGTEADPYIISTAQHLANLAYMVNNGNKYFGCYFELSDSIAFNNNVLASDGSLNSGSFKAWTSIGNGDNSFQGTFNGNGYTIKGVYISASKDNNGLFGSVNSGSIANLRVVDSYIAGSNHTGGIVGQVQYGSLSRCYFDGTIYDSKSSYRIGGICGYVSNSTITACASYGKITGVEYVGGICGCQVSSNISYCINGGDISSIDYGSAGIAAYSSGGSIASCLNTGTITSTSNKTLGAIIGINPTKTTISKTYYLANSCANPTKTVGTSLTRTQLTDGTALAYLDADDLYLEAGPDDIPAVKGLSDIDNIVITNPVAGTGTEKNALPYATNCKYTTTQMVYTPSEVTSGKGTITQIAFNVADAGANTPSELEIYMGHVSARISGASAPITTEKLTLVYSGTPKLASAAGWETIDLTTPFVYNGKSYLAVVVCRKSSKSSVNTYYATTQKYGYTLTRASDTDAEYGALSGTAEYEATRVRPNIQFTKVVIEPVGISFAYANYNVFLGKTKTLRPVFNPADAHNKTLTWTSSNTDVATVSSSGVVTGLALGTTTIKAKTFNGKSTSCTVTVKQPVTEITLSDATATMWVGATKTLTAKVTPTTASNITVKWSSSDKTVAIVSSTGKITAKAAGTCTITCYAADGSGTKTTCEVTVKQAVQSIALSDESGTLWVGKTMNLTATVNPTDATLKTLQWTSSNTKVAAVSSTGTITAKGKGTCTITCTAADGHGATATCDITVKQQVTSIDLGVKDTVMYVGGVKDLNPSVYPSNANIKKLSWKSTDTSVATITSDGVLTAVNDGKAQIICTATDGFNTADTLNVTVTRLYITDKKPEIAEGTYSEGAIVFTRTLTENRYATYCMPYDVDLSDNAGNFINAYVPTDVALIKSSGAMIITVRKLALTETVPAGQPFIVKSGVTGSVAVKNSSAVSIPAEEPASVDLRIYNIGTYFGTLNTDVSATISGTYKKLTELDSEKYLAISTSSGSTTKVTVVNPYRMYIYKNDESSSAKITDIQFAFDEEEATGIKEVISNEESDDKLYNTNGQRINNANAKKGVYIKNGKKYIMK